MPAGSERPSVLFVCVANSCRSQMAEAMARSMVGASWEIWSAGSAPSGRIHPAATELMREIGLHLGAHKSKGLDAVPAKEWDFVVTMGCGDNCPTVKARHRVDWQIPDPVGLSLEQARGVREQIKKQLQELFTRGGGK